MVSGSLTLVNEQAQISMLLAAPGLIATLTAAPLVMRLFYSPEFYGAVDVLRWICLGMMLRVVAWPMGFIVLAKGAKGAFFWTEVAATLVHVGLAADSDLKPATIPIKVRPASGSEDTPWVSNFGIKPPGKRGDFDASKEKADHATITTDAPACRKRDKQPRDCGDPRRCPQYRPR